VQFACEAMIQADGPGEGTIQSVCARYSLTKRRLEDVAEILDAEFSRVDEALYRPRFNVAPTDQAWIVESGATRRVVRPAAWSYRTAAGRPLVNMRGERAHSGSGLPDAGGAKRCAVIADGFYEWPGRGLAPFWFHRADGGLVLLAGLCQKPPGPDVLARFTILTTEPNHLIAKVHDRMPAILSIDRLDEWLTAAPLVAARLIGPAPEEVLVATPVSKHVNSVKHDDPRCIVAAPHAPPAQGSLF